MENLPNENELEQKFPQFLHKLNKIHKNIFYLVCLVVFLSVFYFFLLSAPRDFVPNTVVRVESGMSLRSISFELKKQNIIRSRVFFEAFVIIFGAESHIVSADYLFEDRSSVLSVALRIAKGEYRMAPVSVTIPEGFDADQIADTFVPNLPNFNKSKFLLKAKNLEGYLFPDTYFFLSSDNERTVLQMMSDNFKKKITPLLPEIAQSGKSQKDIIIMASIIEGEAKGDADRGFISGILWRRISIGMPLQVDAAMETYKEKGLPKNPIGNPGIKAIKAAIHPQNSPYLYYLHDKNGEIHYAKTFAEHTKNKLKYLK